jgi:hypothetical protein
MTTDTILARLQRLASGPQGATNAQVAQAFDWAAEEAGSRLSTQVRRGKLIRVRVMGHKVRYFSNPDHAEAFGVATVPLEPKPKRVPKRRAEKVAEMLEPAGHWPMHLPGTPKAVQVPDGPVVVITAAVKRTEGPRWTHDPRYQVGPGERPFGAGFAAVGIGRNVENGKAWEGSVA